MSVNDLEKNDSVYNLDREITYKKLYKALNYQSKVVLNSTCFII